MGQTSPPDGAEPYVSINGELFAPEDAKLSVFDRIFLYGDAVFDSMPLYDGKLILCDRHVDRFYRSAKAVHIDVPHSKAELKAQMCETVRASNLEYGAVRIIISRGEGPPGIVNADEIDEPTVVIMPLRSDRDGVAYGHDKPSTGTARIVSTRAIPSDSFDPRIKSCNYLVNALAERELVGTDADFGIMLNQEGNVAEDFVSNVFVRDEDGAIRTPPAENALAGLTRKLVLEIGADEGYDIAERQLTTYDLYTAEDVFLTASARGMASVTEINGQTIGDGTQSQEVIDLFRAVFDYALNNEYTAV